MVARRRTVVYRAGRGCPVSHCLVLPVPGAFDAQLLWSNDRCCATPLRAPYGPAAQRGSARAIPRHIHGIPALFAVGRPSAAILSSIAFSPLRRTSHTGADGQRTAVD